MKEIEAEDGEDKYKGLKMIKEYNGFEYSGVRIFKALKEAIEKMNQIYLIEEIQNMLKNERYDL